MYKQVEKPKEDRNSAVAHSVVQKKSDGGKSFGFVDNRAEHFFSGFSNENHESSEGTIQQYIIQRVAKRSFGGTFYSKHIRDASTFNSYDAMVEEAAGVMRNRSQQQMITASSLIFMNGYQQSLFCEQKHNPYGNGFASTTQFPIVVISSTGYITIYSAAQFGYSGYDNNGVYVIDHYMPDSAYGHIDFQGSYKEFKERHN